MKKAFRLLSMLLASVMIVSMLYSGKVYAGESYICGDNLQADYSNGDLSIYALDKSYSGSVNAMYEYSSSKSSPWSTNNVQHIYISSDVYSIGSEAFKNMTSVESIHIPSSLYQVSDNAFYGCQNLKDVYYGGTQEQWDNMIANISKGNDFILNARLHCLDLGVKVVDLSYGDIGFKDEEGWAVRNVLDWYKDRGMITRIDEAKIFYDFNGDSKEDISMESSLDGDNILWTGFSVPDKSSYKDKDDIFVCDDNYSFGEESIYDFCLKNKTCQTYYSKVTFNFSVKDMGATVIDLREGDATITVDEANYLDSFREYAEKAGIIDSDVEMTGFSLDLNKDGEYDIEVDVSGSEATVKSVSNYKENLEIDFDEYAPLKDNIMTLQYGAYVHKFYSIVAFKLKDQVALIEEVPAKCEEDGTEAYWKSVDNDHIYSDADAKNKIDAPKAIPKLGHDWGEWKVIKEATVTEEGKEERVCKHDASHKEQRAIPKLTPTPTATPSDNPVSPSPSATPSASPEDRVKQMGEDGTAFSKGASDVAAEAAITSYSSEKDPKGTAFGLLQAKASKVTKNSIKLAWNKSSEAKSYVIYGNKCGTKNKYEKLTTITGSSYTAKKVAGNKVKKGTYYKFLIVALDKDGNVISTSKTIHAATIGGKVGNDKKVTTKAKKNKVSLKAGKTFKLKAKTKAASKKLKVKKHRAVAYESSDISVATVNSKGVIKAVGKGECEVYAYAQNGVSVKIKVKVK